MTPLVTKSGQFTTLTPQEVKTGSEIISFRVSERITERFKTGRTNNVQRGVANAWPQHVFRGNRQHVVAPYRQAAVSAPGRLPLMTSVWLHYSDLCVSVYMVQLIDTNYWPPPPEVT